MKLLKPSQLKQTTHYIWKFYYGIGIGVYKYSNDMGLLFILPFFTLHVYHEVEIIKPIQQRIKR